MSDYIYDAKGRRIPVTVKNPLDIVAKFRAQYDGSRLVHIGSEPMTPLRRPVRGWKKPEKKD